MAFADSNLVDVLIGPESSYNVAPADFTRVRLTGESLNQNIQTTVSNEIRSDRKIPSLVRTSSGPGGDLNVELSYTSFDFLFEGLLANTWTATLAITDTITAQANAGFLEFTSVAADFSGISVGQWVKIGGYVNTTLNTFHRVTAVTAGAGADSFITATVFVAGEAGGGNETVAGAMLRDGVAKKSFSVQKQFTDLTNVFHLFTGMRVGQGQFTFQPGSIVTGSLSFLGSTFLQAGATAVTGVLTPAVTTDVFNAVDNVKGILEDDVISTLDILQLSLNVVNNLRAQSAVGSLSPVGIGYGRANISGAIQAYFEDGALVTRLNSGTKFSLSWRFEDAVGNALIMTLPRAEITSLNVVAGGINQDVVADGQYQATLDTTTACQVQFDRFVP